MKEIIMGYQQYDIVLTTYEMVLAGNMRQNLQQLHWRYIVLDEGHRVKNEHSQMSSSLRSLHYQNLLLLTGTPIQNNLHELWAMLNLLYPELFVAADEFDNAFEINKGQVDQAQIQKTGPLLVPFMLRRLKVACAVSMSGLVLSWLFRLMELTSGSFAGPRDAQSPA
jgi:SNF2 family DNA or RNA helicase